MLSLPAKQSWELRVNFGVLMSFRLKKSELFKYEGHYVSESKYQVKSACNSVPAY